MILFKLLNFLVIIFFIFKNGDFSNYFIGLFYSLNLDERMYKMYWYILSI